MSNDSKYDRLYPKRAVAPLLALARRAEKGHKIKAAEWSGVLRNLANNGFPTNEPLFLLRGQDELAPVIVREYIRLVETEEEAFRGDRPGVINHLYEFVTRMEQWEPRKLPD